MKTKLLSMILFIIIIFSSCYMDSSTSDETSGSIILKAGAPVFLNPPPGFAGEVKIRFFPAGGLDNNISISSDIIYTDDLPVPLSINRNQVITLPYGIENNDFSGSATIDNVPANTPLSMLIENYCVYYRTINGQDSSDVYFMTHAGISNTFTVDKDTTVEVPFTFVETANATVKLDYADHFMTSYYVYFLEPEILDSYVTISGNTITFDRYNPPSYIFQHEGVEITYPVFLDMLPGKKMKILVRAQQYLPNNGPVGVSDTFELNPGEQFSIPVTYYSFLC